MYVNNVSCKDACFTIEELNDVSEVHVVLQDDVPVDLHQRQSNKEDEVIRRDILGCPDGFPDCKNVIIHQLWKTKHRKEQESDHVRCYWDNQARKFTESTISMFDMKQDYKT